MQWMAKIDGTEKLALDLVKPNKFKGPAITWERKPNPTPEPDGPDKTGKPAGNKKPPKTKDASGNEMPTPGTNFAGMSGTSYMYPSTSGGARTVPKVVGLPRTGRRNL
jgi:hypothetical protein